MSALRLVIDDPELELRIGDVLAGAGSRAGHLLAATSRRVAIDAALLQKEKGKCVRRKNLPRKG